MSQNTKSNPMKNLNPEINVKTYESFISKKFISKEQIANIIIQANKDTNFLNINPEDRKIWQIILHNYIQDNLTADDFVLSGHEVDELLRLNPKDIIRYCVYRYKYNIYPKLYIVKKYPPCVQIEIASICNFRCIMCYQADESFSKKSNGYMGFMNMNLFKSCIDDLEGNVEAVTFASRGEPTLNPLFSEMLEYCRGKFIALKLNTNASLLDEAMCHTLLKSDLQTIIFSIDAAKKETYEKIRVNGNFDSVISNLKKFSEIKEKFYPNTKIITRVSGVKINDSQDILDMDKFFSKYVDSSAFVNYNPWETAYTNPINKLKKPCSDLFRRMFIWWDGVINPCDFDYKSVLSPSKYEVNSSTLSDIWLSESYNNLRNIHLQGQRSTKAPCNRCVVI